MPTQVATAREFIDSFNDRQLDRFVETLHPEVEIHAGRGLRRGSGQAREWATRSPEGAQQRIVLERIDEQGDRVLATVRREWWWQDDDKEPEFAHQDEMAWLFRFSDGLVREWHPFDDREDARRAFADRGRD